MRTHHTRGSGHATHLPALVKYRDVAPGGVFWQRSRAVRALGELPNSSVGVVSHCGQLSAGRERRVELDGGGAFDCSVFPGPEASRHPAGGSHHSCAMRGLWHDAPRESGATFSGLATRNPGRCETGGGRVIERPVMTFPNLLPVADGLITGRAVHFLLGSVAGLGCPHNGAIADVDGGTATKLRANGGASFPAILSRRHLWTRRRLGTSHERVL